MVITGGGDELTVNAPDVSHWQTLAETHDGFLADDFDRRCAGCKRIFLGGDYQSCAGCRVAKYCDRECQKVHWKAHKKICAALQKEHIQRARKLVVPTWFMDASLASGVQYAGGMPCVLQTVDPATGINDVKWQPVKLATE